MDSILKVFNDGVDMVSQILFKNDIKHSIGENDKITFSINTPNALFIDENEDKFEEFSNDSSHSVNKDIIYALECENGKYYVGRTIRPMSERFDEHVEGKGSEWTKKYCPIKVIDICDVKGQLDEDIKTKELMMKYGVENVRGGSYVQIVLPDYKLKTLTDELHTASNNKCFKCGENGHYIKKCNKQTNDKQISGKQFCAKCKRFGHVKSMCYAKTDTDGNTLSREKCYKCQRFGHYANNCHYKTNIYGVITTT
jgi:predicted GIY-YIG superfamily endonuclease